MTGSDDDQPHRAEPVDPTEALDPPTDQPGLSSLAGIDLGGLLEQASRMQQVLQDAQEVAASTEVEGVAGGGAVRISVTGGMAFQSVTIDPAAVDPDDVEMLQDLVLAALHDAMAQIGDLQADTLPGLGDAPDLGGLLGGSNE